MLPLLLTGMGMALLLVAFVVVRPRAAKHMDNMIYIGGVTVDQRKLIRRAVLFHGRLPEDESLRPMALKLAKQAAQNLPYLLRWQPLVHVGMILCTSAYYMFPDGVTPGVVFQCLFLALGIYTLVTNVRAIDFARRLLDREPASDGSGPAE